MKRILFIITIALFLTPLSSFGNETNGIDQNLEDISDRCAECAAYYTMVYHAINASNKIEKTETAKAYAKLRETAMFYSLLLASQGRKQDMAVEVTNSRIELYMKFMKQEMDNRNENIAILINKYHFGCEEMMNKPPEEVLIILKTKINEVEKQAKPK